jgi:hypothetical protein
LAEQFEIIEAVSVDVEPGRATMALTDSVFGPCDRFDHPVGSVFATGLARGLGVPVDLEVRASEDARADWQVTCRWDHAAVGDNGS